MIREGIFGAQMYIYYSAEDAAANVINNSGITSKYQNLIQQNLSNAIFYAENQEQQFKTFYKNHAGDVQALESILNGDNKWLKQLEADLFTLLSGKISKSRAFPSVGSMAKEAAPATKKQYGHSAGLERMSMIVNAYEKALYDILPSNGKVPSKIKLEDLNAFQSGIAAAKEAIRKIEKSDVQKERREIAFKLSDIISKDIIEPLSAITLANALSELDNIFEVKVKRTGTQKVKTTLGDAQTSYGDSYFELKTKTGATSGQFYLQTKRTGTKKKTAKAYKDALGEQRFSNIEPLIMGFSGAKFDKSVQFEIINMLRYTILTKGSFDVGTSVAQQFLFSLLAGPLMTGYNVKQAVIFFNYANDFYYTSDVLRRIRSDIEYHTVRIVGINDESKLIPWVGRERIPNKADAFARSNREFANFSSKNVKLF